LGEKIKREGRDLERKREIRKKENNGTCRGCVCLKKTTDTNYIPII